MYSVKLVDVSGPKQGDTGKEKLMSLENITALHRDTGQFNMGCQAKINVVNLFTNFNSFFEYRSGIINTTNY
jgi:hypothetical protein